MPRRKVKTASNGKKSPPDLTKVREVLKGLRELQVHMAAQIKAATNIIASTLQIDLETEALTALESERLARVPTPFGEAKSELGGGEIPPPANGKHYTPSELADPGQFQRPQLAAIFKSMGGDPTGKMPPDLRTLILQEQNPASVGECDFSGDAGVPLEMFEFDGDEYNCGPKVQELMRGKTARQKKKILVKLIDEEIEV